MFSKQHDCEVNELYKSLINKERCTLIDVREYPEYASARISQAQLIPLGKLSSSVSHLEKSCPIYVICRSGRRSKEAQQKLLALGFTDVRNVNGGMLAWQLAKLPIEQSEKAIWSLERQVRFVVGLIVLLASLLSFFVAQSFIWVAAFMGAGLVFAAVTDSCAMGMLIAQLPWNRANDVNNSKAGLQRG
jgi:rhodanese-related sulfurtransferase